MLVGAKLMMPWTMTAAATNARVDMLLDGGEAAMVSELASLRVQPLQKACWRLVERQAIGRSRETRGPRAHWPVAADQHAASVVGPQRVQSEHPKSKALTARAAHLPP